MRLLKTVTVGLLLSLATISAQQQADVFTTLGISSETAQNNIIVSLTSGAISLIGNRSVFKTASDEIRAALVRNVFATARAFTGTTEFANRYASFRAAQRPEREAVPQTGEQALAAQQKQLEEVMRQAEKAAESLSPEQREKLAHNMEYTKKQLAELNADPQHRAAVDAAVKESARQAEADYARRDAEFEVMYPADPKRLIARRLRDFLELSATVDFSAQLMEREKRMRFVDPELEAKPREWKMLYRAGKPAVDAARAAAQEWLKALGV